MKRSIIFAVVLLLLAGVIGAFAWFQFVVKPEMVKGFLAQMGQQPVTITAEPARVESRTPRIPAIGTFRAVQGIDIAPEVAGVIRSIRFESGQEVAAGTVLVQLDDSVEQADLKSAAAQLANAEVELSRQKELLGRGNTAKTSYDAAVTRRDTSAASIEGTRALIAKKSLKAPFRGRLGLRMADVGQYVSSGTALVTLQQLDPIHVDFPVPEQRVAEIRVGQSVEVGVDGWPERVFTGSVTSIDARVNQETRSILVRAELANPESHLLPGMYADVRVLAGESEEVVTVPRTAITYSLYGDSLYVVKPGSPPEGAGADGEPPTVAERRFIRVGDVQDERIAILEGVQAGEMVVTSGQLKLQPNIPVRVDNAEALQAPSVRPKE